MVTEGETERVRTVEVPEGEVSAAFAEAMAYAERWGRRQDDVSAAAVDGATNGVLWASCHCTDLSTFRGFAATVVKRFVWRAVHKLREQRDRRPQSQELTEFTSAEAKPVTPVRPLLIEDLPEDIGFAVRLFFIDGYTLRDCGLLMNKSPNTVDLMLKRAAELLAPGRVKPSRRNGEKRLTAG